MNDSDFDKVSKGINLYIHMYIFAIKKTFFGMGVVKGGWGEGGLLILYLKSFRIL